MEQVKEKGLWIAMFWGVAELIKDMLMIFGFLLGPPLIMTALACGAIWLVTGWMHPIMYAVMLALMLWFWSGACMLVMPLWRRACLFRR